MITLLLVLIFIGILILVHEWGHFYSARKLGVRVEEFGFGFPPKIYSRVKNGVRYSLNLLPLGGFVKIFGEHGEGEGEKESFISRPVWQRFVILSAGVFMNLVLAWVLFSAGSALGVPEAGDGDLANLKNIPVSIIAVLRGSPAEKVGLKFGDKILEMAGRDMTFRIETEKDVRDFVEAYRGEEIMITASRHKEIMYFRAVPRLNYPADEGPLGVALARITVKKTPWYLAPIEGFKTLIRSFVFTIYGLYYLLKDLIVNRMAPVSVSGPVGIFFMVEDTRTLGFSYLLQFVATLSVNLAILNFLPIPALDGGRVLFLAIEKIKRRRLHPRWENFAHAAGFFLLIILMILVTYQDLAKIL